MEASPSSLRLDCLLAADAGRLGLTHTHALAPPVLSHSAHRPRSLRLPGLLATGRCFQWHQWLPCHGCHGGPLASSRAWLRATRRAGVTRARRSGEGTKGRRAPGRSHLDGDSCSWCPPWLCWGWRRALARSCSREPADQRALGLMMYRAESVSQVLGRPGRSEVGMTLCC